MTQPDLFGNEPPEPQPEPDHLGTQLNRLLAASKHLLALVDEYEPERAKKPAWVELKSSVADMEDLLDHAHHAVWP